MIKKTEKIKTPKKDIAITTITSIIIAIALSLLIWTILDDDAFSGHAPEDFIEIQIRFSRMHRDSDPGSNIFRIYEISNSRPFTITSRSFDDRAFNNRVSSGSIVTLMVLYRDYINHARRVPVRGVSIGDTVFLCFDNAMASEQQSPAVAIAIFSIILGGSAIFLVFHSLLTYPKLKYDREKLKQEQLNTNDNK